MKSLTLSPDHAHLPRAFHSFLLVPDRPLRYGLWLRFRDTWAGGRDRSTDPNAGSEWSESPVRSPWLQRLEAECATALAAGRTRAEALVAVIERDRAELESEAAALQLMLSELNESQGATEPEPDDAVVGVGERYSSPAERIARRRWEQAGKRARLASDTSAAKARRRAVVQQIAVLEQERRSHWTVLQERGRQLLAHYQRRAGTYTRAMERRREGERLIAPTLPVPEWLGADLGTAGQQAAGNPLALTSA